MLMSRQLWGWFFFPHQMLLLLSCKRTFGEGGQRVLLHQSTDVVLHVPKVHFCDEVKRKVSF